MLILLICKNKTHHLSSLTLTLTHTFSLKHVDSVIHQSLSASNQYLETQSEIQDRAKQIGVYNTSSWCSADITNEFAVHIRDLTYEVGISLRDTALKVEATVEGLQSDMNQMQEKVDIIDKNLNEISAYLSVAKTIVIVIILIVLCLMLTCILAWMEKLHTVPILMGNSFIVPTLILLMILFWCFTTLSLIGAMAGSDYCNMPDENTVNILVENRDSLSPVMLLFLSYYVTVRVKSMWYNSQIFNASLRHFLLLNIKGMHVRPNANSLERIICSTTFCRGFSSQHYR